MPLADRVAGELEQHFQQSRFRANSDLVFPNPLTGRALDPSKLRVRFKGAVTKAKVRSVRFHDLRHTFATRVAAQGVSLRTLQEWLGHRDFATTLMYADYQPAAREAELVEQAFASNELGNEMSDIEGTSATENVPGSD